MQLKPKIIKWGDRAISHGTSVILAFPHAIMRKKRRRKERREKGKQERENEGNKQKEREKEISFCIQPCFSLEVQIQHKHSVLGQQVHYQHHSAARHTSWEISYSGTPVGKFLNLVANSNTFKDYGGIYTFIDLPLSRQTVPRMDCNCS